MEKNNQPLVSVVIPCYNHEKYVQDTIRSVINQTYENIELIIIDDGSKDSSVEQIKQMIPKCKKRFTHFEFRTRPNKGLSATLNEALKWCQGKYYSAIASDDLMLNDKTTFQVDFLEKNKAYTAVFGGVNLIDKNNNVIGKRVSETKYYTFKQIILNQHDLPASTQLARLETIKELGGYDEKVKIEDWYMLLKMTFRDEFQVYYLNKIMCQYRFHDENFSKNVKIMSDEMRLILKDYSEHKLYKAALIRVYRLEFSYFKNRKKYFRAFFILLNLFKFKLLNK